MNISITILALIAVILGGALAMNKNKSGPGKVCLFSAMSGVLTLDGKPAGGIRLVRTVDFSGPKTDETTTDKSGRFGFPAVFTRTITKYLPQEFVSNQQIVAHYQDKEYRLWYSVKRSPDENSEARGKPLVVQCELNSEQTIIEVGGSPIFSLCTWDVTPDERKDTGSFFDE